MAVPRDEKRQSSLLAVDDRGIIDEFHKHVLEKSGSRDDYWYNEQADDKLTEGLKTRWAKLPFAAERLLKIPVPALVSEDTPIWRWNDIRGAQPYSHEAVARCIIRRVGIDPRERYCFSLLKAPRYGEDMGSHFCISCDTKDKPTLSIEHNVDLRSFTHVVLAERKFHI